MKKTRILALCTMLLLLALLAGCGGGAGVKENKADLNVTVLDQANAPIADALVMIGTDTNLSGTTDASGKITIKNVTLGTRSVVVSKVGYDTRTVSNVAIIDGDNSQTVQLTANGGGQARITLKNPLGKLLAKAAVSIARPATHEVIASTITNLEGVAALNVAAGTYTVKVVFEDYKLFEQSIVIESGKATSKEVIISTDSHPGHIALTGVRLTSDGAFNGELTGISARVVEANTGLETTPTGNDSITVPAGTYVVGITLPTTYVSPTITGGDALATTTIAHYLPGAASGETIYRLVTVPLDGTVTINVQMSARPPAPPLPINTTDLTVSYETFTFAGMPANRTDLRLRGAFTHWGDDNPLMPLAEVNANNVIESGTGRYRLVTLIPCTLHQQAQAQFKASDAAWVTQSTTTVEGDGTAGGNATRMFPSAGHGLVHFSTTAPAGSTVEVRGSMNNWGNTVNLLNPPIMLMETSAGNFERNVYLPTTPTANYEYKYVINGTDWQPANNIQVTVTAEF